MADRAKKISELTVLTVAAGEDLLVVVDDPSGNAVTKSISVTNLLTNSANVRATFIKSDVPALANSTGVGGQITFDSSYVYVCVANNTWKRAQLLTW